MRNTAVKMYARGMLDVGSNYAESRNGTTPVLAAGNDQAIKDVRDNLPLRSAKKIHTDGAAKQGTVPSVIGYDAASALAILEKAGLNVRLSGTGRVVAQSIPKGSPLVKGRKILLTLK
jgi:cell division protein FtsI (penicillin-binding protein 3)